MNLSFLHKALKILVYHETLSCAHRTSRCMRKIFVWNFLIFNFFWLKGAYIYTPNQICNSAKLVRDFIFLHYELQLTIMRRLFYFVISRPWYKLWKSFSLEFINVITWYSHPRNNSYILHNKSTLMDWRTKVK
jgi:hypothetical protein